MSNVLGTLFGNIADAIREKSGETGTMKPAQFPEKIRAIEGGSPDVCYVTFMSHDGKTVLGVKPVAIGDDCADPIARGVFDTPTKESTVGVAYTFAGWAISANGDKSPSALTNVTEDRTVYAAYTAKLREYTINFYDGTTLLQSDTLTYGSTPVYNGATKKDGYSFIGWSPSISTVRGDQNYHAQWEELVGLEVMSWAKIAETCAAGKAADSFYVGESKTIPVTINGVEHEFIAKIVGMNHDTLSDGSGKASLSFMLFTIPEPATHDGAATDFYHKNPIHTKIQDFANTYLPSDLVSAVKSVNKLSSTYNSGKVEEEFSAKFWAPSFAELAPKTGAVYIGADTYELFETQPYYLSGEHAVTFVGSTPTDGRVWIRETFMHFMYAAKPSEQYGITTAQLSGTDAAGMAIGFCI